MRSYNNKPKHTFSNLRADRVEKKGKRIGIIFLAPGILEREWGI